MTRQYHAGLRTPADSDFVSSKELWMYSLDCCKIRTTTSYGITHEVLAIPPDGLPSQVKRKARISRLSCRNSWQGNPRLIL